MNHPGPQDLPEPDPQVQVYTSFMEQVLQVGEWISGAYLVSELGIKKAEECSETHFDPFQRPSSQPTAF